jgi:hypothetical protein
MIALLRAVERIPESVCLALIIVLIAVAGALS